MTDLKLKVGDKVIWFDLKDDPWTVLAIAADDWSCIIENADGSRVACLDDIDPYDPTIKLSAALEAVGNIPRDPLRSTWVHQAAVMDALKGLVK